MEMVLATSEASNTARKLQLSANCWPAGRAENEREKERRGDTKAGQVYCKEVYNFSGSTDRTFVWPQLNDI